MDMVKKVVNQFKVTRQSEPIIMRPTSEVNKKFKLNKFYNS